MYPFVQAQAETYHVNQFTSAATDSLMSRCSSTPTQKTQMCKDFIAAYTRETLFSSTLHIMSYKHFLIRYEQSRDICLRLLSMAQVSSSLRTAVVDPCSGLSERFDVVSLHEIPFARQWHPLIQGGETDT